MISFPQVAFFLLICLTQAEFWHYRSPRFGHPCMCFYERYHDESCANRKILIPNIRSFDRCEVLCDVPTCAAAVFTKYRYAGRNQACYHVLVEDGECNRVDTDLGDTVWLVSVKRQDVACRTKSPSHSPSALPSMAPTTTLPTMSPSVPSPTAMPSTDMPSTVPTTDMPTKLPTFTAPTMSPLAVGPKWRNIGKKSCTNGRDWINLGTARLRSEARQLMYNDARCMRIGAVMFFSRYSYSESWGVRCATPEAAANCNGENDNWTAYELVEFSECSWVPIHGDDCPVDQRPLRYMGGCDTDMTPGELCEADGPLLDGNKNFDINNCGKYDVFRLVCDHDESNDISCTPSWVAITDPNECPTGDLRQMQDCHANMNSGDLCEADSALPNGEQNFNINNCGPFDIFRYECSLNVVTGYSYTMVGDGWCYGSSRFYGVDGIRKVTTLSECKAECDSRADCIGYSGTKNGGRGQCEVYGPYGPADLPNSEWSLNVGRSLEIKYTSGNERWVCYKRI